MSDTPDSQLDALLARLGRDIPPPRDLWPAIEAQASARPFPQHRPWQIAAGIAAVMLIATFTLHLWQRPAPMVAGPALQDVSYLRARAQLEQSYRARLGQLAPDTRQQVERDLNVIRDAREDIRRALASDPGSPLLNELMTTTWQQEIDLFRDVAGNTPVAIRRNL
jgi:hypothetical protein